MKVTTLNAWLEIFNSVCILNITVFVLHLIRKNSKEIKVHNRYAYNMNLKCLISLNIYIFALKIRINVPDIIYSNFVQTTAEQNVFDNHLKQSNFLVFTIRLRLRLSFHLRWILWWDNMISRVRMCATPLTVLSKRTKYHIWGKSHSEIYNFSRQKESTWQTIFFEWEKHIRGRNRWKR